MGAWAPGQNSKLCSSSLPVAGCLHRACPPLGLWFLSCLLRASDISHTQLFPITRLFGRRDYTPWRTGSFRKGTPRQDRQRGPGRAALTPGSPQEEAGQQGTGPPVPRGLWEAPPGGGGAAGGGGEAASGSLSLPAPAPQGMGAPRGTMHFVPRGSASSSASKSLPRPFWEGAFAAGSCSRNDDV